MEKYLSATPQATVLITILTAAFFINALVYLFRLVCSLIWREKKPRKYGGLWKLPYCMLLLLGIHPPRTFSYPMLGICLILWFFALACAIIQLKVPSKMTWRSFLEDSMRRLVCGIELAREWILKAGEKADQLYLIPFVIRLVAVALTFLVVVIIAVCVPVLAVPFLIVYYLLAAILTIYKSMHSCGRLLSVWLLGSFAVSTLGAAAILELLPSDMENPLILYIAVVLLITLSWNITALLADYDVAKMACNVVNTITTIAMLFVNICFYWCSAGFIQWLHEKSPQLADLASIFTVEEYIYGSNMLLFPLVAAGFIAALFVEGKQYILKRMDILNEVTRN